MTIFTTAQMTNLFITRSTQGNGMINAHTFTHTSSHEKYKYMILQIGSVKTEKYAYTSSHEKHAYIQGNDNIYIPDGLEVRNWLLE